MYFVRTASGRARRWGRLRQDGSREHAQALQLAVTVYCYVLATHQPKLSYVLYTLRPDSEGRFCRWQRTKDVLAGSLPADVVLTLPSYHFSVRYLRSMALCSRTLLRAARDNRNWSDAIIDATGSEFGSTQALRQAERLWSRARHIILTIPQLAAHFRVPENVLIRWAGWTNQQPRRAGDRVYSWESQILLGSAQFVLIAPFFTQSLYIGIQSPNSNRRAFCYLTWPFTSDMTVHFGLDGGPFVRRTSPLPKLNAGLLHHVSVHWNPRWFSVSMDGQLLSFATVLDGVPDAPAAQAKLFVWAVTVPYPLLRSPMVITPMLTSSVHNPIVRCCLCGYEGFSCSNRWGVCTLCQNWACSDHVRRNPLRRCPTCVLLLEDYLAGKTLEASASERLTELLTRDDDIHLRHPQPHFPRQARWFLLDDGHAEVPATATCFGALSNLFSLVFLRYCVLIILLLLSSLGLFLCVGAAATLACAALAGLFVVVVYLILRLISGKAQEAIMIQTTSLDSGVHPLIRRC